MLNLILSSLILFFPSSVSALDTSPSENTNSGELILAQRQHAPIPNIYDLTYHEARKRLIRAGWQPYTVRYYRNIAETYGNVNIFLKRGYTELIDCSGTGVGACFFEFTDAYGNYLTVTTIGQETPKHKSYASVERWKLYRVPYSERNGL